MQTLKIQANQGEHAVYLMIMEDIFACISLQKLVGLGRNLADRSRP